MRITASVDLSQLRQLALNLAGERSLPWMRQAVNREGRRARTWAVRRMRELMRIPAQMMRSRVRFHGQEAKSGGSYALLSFIGHGRSRKARTKPRHYGLKYRRGVEWGGGQAVARRVELQSFVAAVFAGPTWLFPNRRNPNRSRWIGERRALVFRRYGGRMPIEQVYGPTVGEVAARFRVPVVAAEQWQSAVVDEFARRVRAEVRAASAARSLAAGGPAGRPVSSG